MIREDAVFDRPEQGGDDAIAEDGEEENDRRLHEKADAGQPRDRDLCEFQAARNKSLVIFVRKLTT